MRTRRRTQQPIYIVPPNMYEEEEYDDPISPMYMMDPRTTRTSDFATYLRVKKQLDALEKAAKAEKGSGDKKTRTFNALETLMMITIAMGISGIFWFTIFRVFSG